MRQGKVLPNTVDGDVPSALCLYVGWQKERRRNNFPEAPCYRIETP